MRDVVIKVENLGKQYHLGSSPRHDTLRDAMTSTFNRSNLQTCQRSNDTIWALKDVSFQVERGEVLGIIGRNGAGKSTLLKIVSRITEPTEGETVINGRAGSLLEVGTGFHPELTAREHVYLSGAILGMIRAKIDRKFDELVAGSSEDPSYSLDLIPREAAVAIGGKHRQFDPTVQIHVTLHVYVEQQTVAFTTASSADPDWETVLRTRGVHRSLCHIPAHFLNTGHHRVNVLVVRDRSRVIHKEEDALSYDIVETGERAAWFGRSPAS